MGFTSVCTEALVTRWDSPQTSTGQPRQGLPSTRVTGNCPKFSPEIPAELSRERREPARSVFRRFAAREFPPGVEVAWRGAKKRAALRVPPNSTIYWMASSHPVPQIFGF